MTDKDRLIIAQALYNVIAEECSTKDPDNLRGRVSEEYKKLYHETGAKSFDMRLDGVKVGTMSVTVTKPTDSKEVDDFVISDEKSFQNWEGFEAAVRDYAQNHLQQIADWHFGLTGEVPDGCELTHYIVAGSPGGEVSKTTLKIDTPTVIETMQNRLPEAINTLLLGENND